LLEAFELEIAVNYPVYT